MSDKYKVGQTWGGDIEMGSEDSRLWGLSLPTGLNGEKGTN